jgi:hypothetical protein
VKLIAMEGVASRAVKVRARPADAVAMMTERGMVSSPFSVLRLAFGVK